MVQSHYHLINDYTWLIIGHLTSQEGPYYHSIAVLLVLPHFVDLNHIHMLKKVSHTGTVGP